MDWLWIALETSAAGQLVRSDPLLYPAANILHVLALMVFFAVVATMDVRLLGGFRAVSLSGLLFVGRRVALAALLGQAATGIVMFIADAVALSGNPAFLAKMALLVLGLGNVALLQRILSRRAASDRSPDGTEVPVAVRVCAVVSLAVWLVVAALGRLIAYV